MFMTQPHTYPWGARSVLFRDPMETSSHWSLRPNIAVAQRRRGRTPLLYILSTVLTFNQMERKRACEAHGPANKLRRPTTFGRGPAKRYAKATRVQGPQGWRL